MKSTLNALLAGLLFGAGLIVSGMVNPAKVIGFLDLTGQWDPSLALVMASAIGLSWLGVRLAARRSDPACPTDAPARPIDKPLVLGSIMFGIGWGVSGFCPRPGGGCHRGSLLAGFGGAPGHAAGSRCGGDVRASPGRLIARRASASFHRIHGIRTLRSAG